MGVNIQVLASGSSGNCYAVDDGQTKIMIEVGMPWKQIQRALNFETHTISAVLCSHSHSDHSLSIKAAMKAGLDCYMSRDTASALGLIGHRLHIVEPMKQFTVGKWAVMPFDTRHDAEGSLGFLLASETGERLVYLTDSVYSRYRFEGITCWMLEINYDTETIKQNVADGIIDREHYKRVIRSHCSLETAVELLKANDLSKTQGLWIIHMSNENANAERIKRTLQEAFGKPVYLKTQGPPC